MKRLCIVVFAILIAAAASASTVVLKTGKKLDVARFETRGDLVVVFYADGRVESYPASLVDRGATDAANAVPTAVASPTPAGPRSPFLGALAKSGETGAVIKDEDVRHVEKEQEQGETQPEEKKEPSAAEIVLTGYDRNQLDDGSWEITANVSNKGGLPAKNVSVAVRALDKDGKVVGNGSGTLEGELAAGAAGTVKVKLAPTGSFVQLSFDLGWQELHPEPTPVPKPASTAGGAQGATPATAPVPRYGVAPGSSPNSVPQNPNARPPLLTSPQVAPAPPPPKGGGGSPS